jgi:DNA primase
MPPRSKRAVTEVLVSNPDKVLYPSGKFTKADVVEYYRRVAPFLLPHFRDRPSPSSVTRTVFTVKRSTKKMRPASCHPG